MMGKSPLKILGLVVVALVIGGAVFLFKDKIRTKVKASEDVVTFGQLGVDAANPSADALYAAVARDCVKRWTRDAILWSVNFQGVRADGTVDLAQGASVLCRSRLAAASSNKAVLKDAMVVYSAAPLGMKVSNRAQRKAVAGVEELPIAKCTIKMLMAKLLADGRITDQTTAHIGMNPDGFGVRWTANVDAPKFNGLFDWNTCEPSPL